MTKTNETENSTSCCSGETRQGDIISHCPMAAKFETTIGNPKLNLNLRIIGIALFILGIVIIIEPKIIAWLMALVAMLMGLALLIMAHYLNRLRSSTEPAGD
jgi:hypothetical protein